MYKNIKRYQKYKNIKVWSDTAENIDGKNPQPTDADNWMKVLLDNATILSSKFWDKKVYAGHPILVETFLSDNPLVPAIKITHHLLKDFCNTSAKKLKSVYTLLALITPALSQRRPILRRPLFRQEQVSTYRHLGPLLTPPLGKIRKMARFLIYNNNYFVFNVFFPPPNKVFDDKVPSVGLLL